MKSLAQAHLARWGDPAHSAESRHRAERCGAVQEAIRVWGPVDREHGVVDVERVVAAWRFTDGSLIAEREASDANGIASWWILATPSAIAAALRDPERHANMVVSWIMADRPLPRVALGPAQIAWMLRSEDQDVREAGLALVAGMRPATDPGT